MMLTHSVIRAKNLEKGFILFISGTEYKVQDLWHFYLSHWEEEEYTGGLEHFVRITLTSSGKGKIHRDFHPELDILCLVPESPTL